MQHEFLRAVFMKIQRLLKAYTVFVLLGPEDRNTKLLRNVR